MWVSMKPIKIDIFAWNLESSIFTTKYTFIDLITQFSNIKFHETWSKYFYSQSSTLFTSDFNDHGNKFNVGIKLN